MNQRPSGRIPNNPDGGSYVFQRHASQMSLINRATWTVQKNLEPPTLNRVGAVNSGHLLETLDLRCVFVIGPKKEVEC